MLPVLTGTEAGENGGSCLQILNSKESVEDGAMSKNN
jgi:hypothetical protein